MWHRSRRSVPVAAAVLAVLKGGRALVRRGWTKHAKARDASGRAVRATSAMAVSHCADGSLRAAAGDRYGKTPVYRAALRVLSGVVAGGISPAFNDLPETRKRDVLAAFGRAIKRAARR